MNNSLIWGTRKTSSATFSRYHGIFTAKKYYSCAARTHFLDVAYHLFVKAFVICKSKHRSAVRYKGNRTVLEFSCGVRLTVDIGYFLKLERRFHT